MENQEKHQYCTKKFIDLANKLKNEGNDPHLISAALMSASGIYATYSAAGPLGGLEPSGVDKTVNLYRRTLEHIQVRKRAEVKASLKKK